MRRLKIGTSDLATSSRADHVGYHSGHRTQPIGSFHYFIQFRSNTVMCTCCVLKKFYALPWSLALLIFFLALPYVHCFIYPFLLCIVMFNIGVFLFLFYYETTLEG